MDNCPLKAYKAYVLTNEEIKKARQKGVTDFIIDAVMALLGPILTAIVNAALDAIEQGMSMVDSVVDTVGTALNSINPESWILYGIRTNATTIRDAAIRERSLIDQMIAMLKRMTRESDTNSKYKALSKRAQSVIRQVKSALVRAAKNNSAAKILFEVKNADRGMDIVLDILRGNTKKANDALDDLIKTAKFFEKSMTHGTPLKDIENEIDKYSEEMFRSLVRDTIVEVMKVIDTYRELFIILYLYAGINFVPAITKHKRRLEALAESLSINWMMDTAYDQGDPELKQAILDEIEVIVKDIKKLATDAWNDVKGRTGFYMFSMSPSFNAFEAITQGEFDADISNTDADTFSALMHISPYSPISAGSLTMFGASTKISSAVSTYNTLWGRVKEMSEKKASDSDRDDARYANKIQEAHNKINAANAEINIDDYKFDNPGGMASSRADGISDKAEVRRIVLTSGLAGLARDDSNNAYIDLIVNTGKLELNVSEPAMGIAIIVRLFLVALVAPLYIPRGVVNNTIEILEGRRLYLNGIISKATPITNYNDPEIEAMLAMLESIGLGNTAAAARAGAIAAGLTSVAASVIGILGTINEIIKECLPSLHDKTGESSSEDENSIYEDIQEFVKDAKDKFNKIIEDAIDIILKKVGYGIDVVNDLAETSRKCEEKRKEMERLVQTTLDLAKNAERLKEGGLV